MGSHGEWEKQTLSRRGVSCPLEELHLLQRLIRLYWCFIRSRELTPPTPAVAVLSARLDTRLRVLIKLVCWSHLFAVSHRWWILLAVGCKECIWEQMRVRRRARAVVSDQSSFANNCRPPSLARTNRWRARAHRYSLVGWLAHQCHPFT